MKFYFKNILMKIILVVLTVFNFSYTYAEECGLVVHGSDMMKFDTNEIHINKNCEKFVVNLKHSGNLPVNAMGHNIVFLESNNLQKVISKINMSHGIENGFMPEMDEILFKSKMIGGGEETTLELDPNVFISGKEYIFICSFPGHFALMKGKLNI
ncbi:MAG: azurin [Proteobacteria bacterium]|nr:MAG: azurin [Pseudomonadota bacterium]